MRPSYITQEDIIRWSENVNNDKDIPQWVKDSPVIMEVCLAGLFLAEELDKLGCPKDKILSIQFNQGRLSFGRDPWSVSEYLLDKYKNKELEFDDETIFSN